MISGLNGSNRCLIATPRQRRDGLTGYLSLMGTDLILRWILSTNYCDQNKILLAIFPPHLTHTLQPLDVVLFKPLSTAYSAALSRHLHSNQGLLRITKGDFFPLFWKAWVSSFKKETILRSFQATGIWPINSDVILQRFSKFDLDRQQSLESSTSVLNGSEWRKVDRLVRAAVKDQSSKDARKLSQSFHHLSVQN